MAARCRHRARGQQPEALDTGSPGTSREVPGILDRPRVCRLASAPDMPGSSPKEKGGGVWWFCGCLSREVGLCYKAQAAGRWWRTKLRTAASCALHMLFAFCKTRMQTPSFCCPGLTGQEEEDVGRRVGDSLLAISAAFLYLVTTSAVLRSSSLRSSPAPASTSSAMAETPPQERCSAPEARSHSIPGCKPAVPAPPESLLQPPAAPPLIAVARAVSHPSNEF